MEKLSLRLLSMEDVLASGVLDMKRAIHDIETVYSLYEKGDTITPTKSVLRWGETKDDEFTSGRINSMPAYVGGEVDLAGIKWIGSNPQNPGKYGLPRASGLIILNDPVTKVPLAVMDGTVISAVRTGAATGVAAKYLSMEKAEKLVLVGAGVQNRTQLAAVLSIRPGIKTVLIYDLFYQRSQVFASEMSERLQIDIKPVKTTAELGKDADIVVTATTTTTDPIVQADWLKAGSFYSNVSGVECTYETVRKADKIVVDNWEAVKHRKSSTASRMAAEGLLSDQDIHGEMGEIINGKKKGRETDDEIIYFNSTGMGILDIAVAGRIYKEALKQNKGREFVLWENPFFV